MSEMTPSDMMAMMNNAGGGMNSWSNNPFFYLIFMWMFGNGFGNWGGNNSAAQNSLTRAELADGLNNQTVLDDLRVMDSNVSSTGASVTQALNNGFNGIQQSLCSGFGNTTATINETANNTVAAINGTSNTLNNSINANSNAINASINRANFDNQMGFSNLNNTVGNLKYEMAQNCCELKTAMHAEGEATRALMTANQIQDLRDKVAEKDNALQSANLTLANSQQTQNILSNMGRFVPYGSNVSSF